MNLNLNLSGENNDIKDSGIHRDAFFVISIQKLPFGNDLLYKKCHTPKSYTHVYIKFNV